MTKDEQIASLAVVIADLQRKLDVSDQVQDLQLANFRESERRFEEIRRERDAMSPELEARRKAMEEAPKIVHRALVRVGVTRKQREKVEALLTYDFKPEVVKPCSK